MKDSMILINFSPDSPPKYICCPVSSFLVELGTPNFCFKIFCNSLTPVSLKLYVLRNTPLCLFDLIDPSSIYQTVSTNGVILLIKLFGITFILS